jgi:hypothetical protein
MGAMDHGPDASRAAVATRESWKIEPPRAMVPFQYRASFSPDEYAILRRGLVPQQMEDKWFILWENDWLSFYRSWTGFCIYQLQFGSNAGRHEVIQALVCDDASQYRRRPDTHEAALVDFLIRGLLLDQRVEFPIPSDVAAVAGVYQHHIAGTAYPTRTVEASMWPGEPWYRRIWNLLTRERRQGELKEEREANDVKVVAAMPEATRPDNNFGLAPETIDRAELNKRWWKLVPGACFVCGAPNSYHLGRSRMACTACLARTRLVDGGALLSDVLRSEGGRLEGSTLAFLLNPVEIDGHRGWTDFVAGGVGVHEEVHPSTDMFDFNVQHDLFFGQLIHSIQTAALISALETRRLIDIYVGLSGQARENLDKLCALWSRAKAGQAVRAGKQLKTSDEVRRLADKMSEVLWRDDWLREMLLRIAELSRRASANAR